MTKKYALIGTDTVLILKQGLIEDESTDAIINWVYPGLRTGPESFFSIHKKAGNQLFSFAMSYELTVEEIKDADCFSTMPGLLDCRIVLHSVVPEFKQRYHTSYHNIAEVLQTYRKSYKCDSVSLNIIEAHDMQLVALFANLFHLGLKEIVIVYKKPEELKILEEYFGKLKRRKTLGEYVDSFLKWYGSVKWIRELTDKYYGRETNTEHSENN